MEMASPLTAQIPAYQPPPKLRPDQSAAERARLFALLVSVAVGFSLTILVVLAFGR
jgi:SSS family solute:Na+ symporter